MGRVSIEHQVLEKNKPAIDGRRLIETRRRIPRSLIDSHDPNVGTSSPQRPLDTQDRVIRAWIRPGSSGIHIHGSQLESAECAGDLGSAIDGDFLPRDRVNPNLAAEKKLVRALAKAQGKGENARVLQKKLPLLRKEQLVGCEVELLHIDIAVGEVRVHREIGHQVGAQSNLYVDAARVQGAGAGSQAAGNCVIRQMAEAAQSIGLDDKQPPPSDFGNAM